jgi:hypothetical protein
MATARPTLYNVQGKLKHDQIDDQLNHQGELPTFTKSANSLLA